MKRFCVMLAQVLRGDAYIECIRQAWEACGVEFCRISTKAPDKFPNKDRSEADADRGQQITLGSVMDRAMAEDFDELIVMTDELMGPLFPLEELLARADQCGDHAWVLTTGAPMWGLRKKVLAWRPRSVQEIADCCRSLQAPSLYNASDLKKLTDVPMLDEPLALAREKRCPFFLHEVFHRDYTKTVTTTLGQQGQRLYRWLRLESGWDTNLLWDYLLSNCHQQDYFYNMHLEYILPVDRTDEVWAEKELPKHSIALVMHLYYPDKVAESCAFAMRFPPQTHVIITTGDENKKRIIEKAFSNANFASLDVRVIQNRGRDVSALLVGAADVFDQYEFVCFFHDKKSTPNKPQTIGVGFAYKLNENLFASRGYVLNTLRLLCDNPRMGLLSPPPPHHGPYFLTYGSKWVPNYKITRKLHHRLKLQAPISEDKLPIAPLGTCFWFRGGALKPLADYGWKYEDFPPEPNKPDGTLLHAVERIYPYACVEAGYYPAYAMSTRYAAIEYSSLRHYIAAFNTVCVENKIQNYWYVMRDRLKEQLNARLGRR